MPDIIILDTNILMDISRGNRPVAEALKNYVRSGTPVHIARAAYDELVTRAKTPYLGGHYREMLKDMKITIAPAGVFGERVNLYADNIAHEPKPGQPGRIKEYGRNQNADKPGDVFVAANAKSARGLLWTLDEPFQKRAVQQGVKLAPECAIKGMSGTDDPVVGRRLLGLKPKLIASNGQLLPAPRVPVTSGRGVGSAISGLGNGSGGLQPSARGQGKVAGALIIVESLHRILSFIIDRQQKYRVEEELARIGPDIERERHKHPYQGVLIRLRYRRAKGRPEALGQPSEIFDSLRWAMGITRDEASEQMNSKATISAGPGQGEELIDRDMWVRPIMRSDVTAAKCPFPPIALGRFVREGSHAVRFQRVAFGPVGGFDDVHQHKVKLPDDRSDALKDVQFAILSPPTLIQYPDGSSLGSVDIALEDAVTSNGHSIKVVNLDVKWNPFDAKAAMVFPVDEWSERVFQQSYMTDNLQSLRFYPNFPMIRWIRPENIQLLRYL